ncbi:formylglycine-generating enzyme family protein [Thiothrix winogradskyi]|uniref:Formylglycine-generating enzyme family protein n=1 Tax=Thiothrix winogradskyi TaxID=96472 RepID=A0ABY3T001_9GAMM|nr:formylglycine-generating enzyme family protein [Thiothrix winogradskyi]UJS24071.1 formylglycine-generating enzyme family protein [Thiothrix winogradskyi]
MSFENALKNSTDSNSINTYLKFLADKSIKTDNYNADLSERLQLLSDEKSKMEKHNADLTEALRSNEDSYLKIEQAYWIISDELRLYKLAYLISLTPFSWSGNIEQDHFGDYVDLIFEDVINRFRWIPPGSFLMGSPTSEFGRDDDEIQHSVTLTEGFWMADTVCTQALWLAVMSSNPSVFSQNLENPVDSVSWGDVQIFLQRANNSDSGGVLRLPFEAEWEYACRAGTDTPFAFDAITPRSINYNGHHPYVDGVQGLYREETKSVKSLRANAWGLYQMHGNVWEWCQDWYDDYPSSSVSDPIGAESGTYHVLRGGSWFTPASLARSAQRHCDEETDERYSNYGFRLVLG